jgi:DUF1680 family protein
VVPRHHLTDVELLDGFWAPRRQQLHDHTLDILLERFESHGVLDNYRRLGDPRSDLPRQGWWFTDSDLYKWMEATAWAGRTDLLAPVAELVAAVQSSDGYLHTYYGTDGHPARYSDLVTGHELYCFGHLIEAALAADAAGIDVGLLEVAERLAGHIQTTFGRRLDPRTDAHPEIELALVRLGGRLGRESLVELAAWMIDAQLEAVGLSVDTVDLSGHAVRALYLASGIAEVATATGSSRHAEAADRLFDSMVGERSYETGAVGGRWLGEAAGRRYELPASMSYAESCAAVAATQFSARVHRLGGRVDALDQVELLLHNAVPCGVSATGDRWFYSQPHAVEPGAVETNPWVIPLDYGQAMLMEWFPAHRHEWFEVTCCPPNLARMFATAHHHVASICDGPDGDGGDLQVHLPLAARLRGGGWDVTVDSPWPEQGDVSVSVHAAPTGARVRFRRPVWVDPGDVAGATERDHRWIGVPHTGGGPHPVMRLRPEPRWWCSDPRVEAATGTVHLRRGPFVMCAEGPDLDGVDPRLLVVDPTRPPEHAVLRCAPAGGLHRPWTAEHGELEAMSLDFTEYHAWGNRGAGPMQLRFRAIPGCSAD